MTQCGDPLHNAMAERINNTIKNEWPYSYENLGYEEILKAVSNSITMYNIARPHSTLDMKTPFQKVTGNRYNPLLSPTLADISQMSIKGI